MSAKIKTSIAILVFTALGLGVAFGIGQIGQLHQTLPIILICAIWAYVLNWLAFIPAILAKTEKYYDLIGSLTYISTISLAVYLSAPISVVGWVVAAMVMIWAIRLGSFLFLRIKRDKHDKRFDEIKTNGFRFLLTWTLQGAWVVLTSAAALTVITSTNQAQWGVITTIGFVLWAIGFAIEVIADSQKSAFRKDIANKNKFINSGLWARSQHPNYFGEILLWVGVAVMAVPILSGWSWLALISPLFVMFLLLKVSGIPMLQKAGLKKWGDNPDYMAYRENTPKLIPKLF
jgi:steroid 5-alpha reductase family enzyme